VSKYTLEFLGCDLRIPPRNANVKRRRRTSDWKFTIRKHSLDSLHRVHNSSLTQDQLKGFHLLIFQHQLSISSKSCPLFLFLSKMDISLRVYSALGFPMNKLSPELHIDEDAELSKPKPKPLRQPRPIYTTGKPFRHEPHSSLGFQARIKTKDERRKHESYELSGSIFLVTSHGRTLNLPMPSDSKRDPLTYGRWKRTGAFFAIMVYSVTSLTVVQAASLMMPGIVADFSEQVRLHVCPRAMS